MWGKSKYWNLQHLKEIRGISVPQFHIHKKGNNNKNNKIIDKVNVNVEKQMSPEFLLKKVKWTTNFVRVSRVS